MSSMQKPNRNRNPFRNTLTYLILGLALLGLFSAMTGGGSLLGNMKEITSSEFMTQLEAGKIEEFEVQIGSGVYHIKGKYVKDSGQKKEENEQYVQIFQGSPNERTFSTDILGNDATLDHVSQVAKEQGTKFKALPESSVGLWLNFLPVLLMVVPVFFLMYTMMQSSGNGRGMMNFGKSKSKDISKQKVKVKFTDVAGAEEEKQELVEIVEFLKDPKRFTKLGARIPAGVLLEGPPGTGKTLLAKAVAGEAGVPFFSISGSEFVEMFVGVGASRVRDLFENAKKNAPSIIFIDEIDAVGRQRGAGLGGGHDEREQTLNQLLVEMDGFEGNEGVIVIAATNRSDVLDPALLRPGRFDRQILVGNPDVKGREAILKVHARNKKLAKDVDLKVIAQQTPGFSGADLENLLNEAALLAARFNRTMIYAQDIDEAHDRVIAGPAKKDKVISEEQRRIVAFHEAGHTVIGMVLSKARTVHKVTIVPRGRAGGYAIMLPKEDQYIVTYEELFEQVVGLLGGRSAEEIVFNHQSTGASDDFRQATAIVRSMVMKYGMSEKIGTVQYESDSKPFAGRQYGSGNHPDYSQEVAYEMDKEIHRIMGEAHEEALKIIKEHREQLNTIAEKLLELETLDARQIKSLFETGEMPQAIEKDEQKESNSLTLDDPVDSSTKKEESTSNVSDHAADSSGEDSSDED